MFKSLEIHTWRQIEQVEIQFHPRLTILTGANGSGKTTILNLISRHFGWSIPLVSTPKRDKKSGLLSYVTDFWKRLSKDQPATGQPLPSRHIIGEVVYEDSQVATLSIPANDPTFVIEIQP